MLILDLWTLNQAPPTGENPWEWNELSLIRSWIAIEPNI